ncbi:MAG: lamin tail domain-containing protein, partial [Pirellulales bacterium]
LIVPFHPELDTEAMAAFLEYYAVADPGKMLGPFSGTLANDRDTVRLMRADAPAWWEPDIIPHVLEDEIPYENEDPWPVAPDGDSLYRRGIDRWGPDPASWGAAAPSPGAVDLQAGTLAITEINYHPSDPTPAELAIDAELQDEDFEFIELLNIAGTVVDLSGMWLRGAVGFQFPETTLSAGQRAVVVSNATAFQARYGTDLPILGQFQRHLGGSERIELVGSSGQTLLSFRYGDELPWPGRADGQGSSLELIDVYSDYGDADSWRASTEYGGSPGESGAGPIDLVVINEVFTDRVDPANDRIELFNRARGSIDISGWTLSNSGNDPARYRIPEGTVLAAHGYVTFDGADLAAPQFGAGFAIDPNGQNDLYLLQTDTLGRVTHFADHVQFGASAEGESWGRWPSGDGDLYPMVTPTLDVESGENSGPRVGPVVISELMYHPRDPGDLIEQNDLEYVEIYNPTDEPIDLAGWQLEDGVTFSFDDNTSLAPREALIVVRFDPADEQQLDLFRSHYGIRPWVDIVGSYSGSLSNRGDSVRLLRAEDPGPDGPEPLLMLLEDEVRYDDQAPWPITADGFGHSLNRDAAGLWGNDVVSWKAAPPSPGMVEPRVSTLAITELNYQPYAPTPSELAVDPSWTRDDFEFIELLNVSGEPLELADIRFVEGILFDFPDATLAPAERMLLVNDPTAFEQRYGASDVLVVSLYDDTLSDTGERITLLDGADEVLLRFTYGSSGDWPDRTAGMGSSLDLIDLAGYYNDPDNWRASGPYGGTPGSVGEGLQGDVVVNEVLANTDDPLLDAIELFNTTDQTIDIGGWTLSNNSDNYPMFLIPDGTTIAAHGYAVFDGTELFTTGGIDLNGQGDRLWLLEAVGDQPIRFVDDIQFGMAAPGRSLGRWPDGQGPFLPLVSPTIDAEHPEQGANSPVQAIGSLVVTELNYNPYQATPEEEALGFSRSGAFEFIELYNASPFPYDLTGLRFTEGIEFNFDQGSLLEIGSRAFLIVARNVAAFEARYGTGLNVVGPYRRGLSNRGEQGVLTTQFDETVLDVSYDDFQGW